MRAVLTKGERGSRKVKSLVLYSPFPMTTHILNILPTCYNRYYNMLTKCRSLPIITLRNAVFKALTYVIFPFLWRPYDR